MILPGVAPTKLLFFSIVLVVVVATSQLTQAKSIRSLGYSNLRSNDAIKMRRGGCAAFGHSCFGGHGKRTDGSMSTSDLEESSGGVQGSADDGREFLGSDGVRIPVEIFSRDQTDNNDLNLVFPPQYREPQDYFKFSPLFRKWLVNSYRRGDLLPLNQ